jgi:ABC-type glycerol-3-phosphate transport system substrate-binding protein
MGRRCNRVSAVVIGLALMSSCAPARQAHLLTIAVALLPSELPAYRSVLDEFTRQTGLRVVVVPQQYADIRRALAAEAHASSGTLDLVELDVYSLALSAAHVAVLDEQELRPEIDSLAVQSVAAGRVDGLRFLPHRVAWQALIYDHAVLGRPPATWTELLSVARSHPGKIGLKGAMYEGLTCDLLPFVWSAGGSGEKLDDAGAKQALHFLSELAPYLHPASATFKEATIAEAMARGELILHLNWPFVMSLYASQGLAPDRIRSAPLPQSSRSAGPPVTVLGGGYLAVPRNAPHRADALLLLRYLVGRQAQERLRDTLGWFSPRTDVEMDAGKELLAGFAAMREHTRPRPARQDYPLLSRLWQKVFRAVVFEGADSDAVLDAAERELRQERGELAGASR